MTRNNSKHSPSAILPWATGVFPLRSTLLPLAIVLFSAWSVSARTYIVTDTNDTTQVTSLRGAIIAANQLPGFDLIYLRCPKNQPRTFFLTLQGSQEDGCLTGDLDITSGQLAIIGLNGRAVIDASGLADRVLEVQSNATVYLENLTVRGGLASTHIHWPDLSGEDGGGIYNAGTLIIKGALITDNAAGYGGRGLGNGPGASGGNGGAIFNSGHLTIENSTLAGNQGGLASYGAFGGDGGGIYNLGIARLNTVIFSNNYCGEGGRYDFGGPGGNGGAIFNDGQLLVANSWFDSNFTGRGGDGGAFSGWIGIAAPGGFGAKSGDGGAIYNSGNLLLTFCVLGNNHIADGGAGGHGQGIIGIGGRGGDSGNGAGIFNAGSLHLNTCTISHNSIGSGGLGGRGFGLLFMEYAGLAGNGGKGGSGAGVYNAGMARILSSTICLNQAGVGGNGGGSSDILTTALAGNGGNGGGVFNDPAASLLTLRNCLVAQNLFGDGGNGSVNIAYISTFTNFSVITNFGPNGIEGFGPDVSGIFVSKGFNLIGAGDGSTGFTNGVKSDLVGIIGDEIDPLLGPLQFNGGPTPTHALATNSPAVDQGNSFGVHTDQRDHRRPQNYKGIANAGDGSDIGAFELDQRPPTRWPRHDSEAVGCPQGHK